MFKHDPQIIILLYEFFLTKGFLIQISNKDNNAISFSPNIFPLGFKGVLVAYTYRLISPQDFPIGFLEEFYKIISKED
jgi:branched-subunit amino acid transport protein AzlD